MFIFERPLGAVAAGLGVALLMAYLGAGSDDPQPARDPARCRSWNSPACALSWGLSYRPRRFVTFPFPAACRPLRLRVGFRV